MYDLVAPHAAVGETTMDVSVMSLGGCGAIGGQFMNNNNARGANVNGMNHTKDKSTSFRFAIRFYG